MKLKKLTALILALIMTAACCAFVSSAAEGTSLPLSSGIGNLKDQFIMGVGPETDGHTIDYRYYSPVGENDSTKYPLVIWLHGMGQGANEGKQVRDNDIAYWTSSEFQSRFKGSKGAFILAPRSLEEKELYWSDSLIYPLRATIDSFIAQNKDNVDISRIYIGGFSMGGKMTLKMAVAYPEMFAAAFPICPAWAPTTEETVLLADMPIWLTSGALDPLVGYFTMVKPTWKNIIAVSNVKENCRFSTLARTAYPSGMPTLSSHHSWFAVNYDMFSEKNGDYPAMTTVNGLGDEITLTYPDGMISWLSGFESDFDGSVAIDSGNPEAQNGGSGASFFDVIKDWFKTIFRYIGSLFTW